jgi:hypothetical protein
VWRGDGRPGDLSEVGLDRAAADRRSERRFSERGGFASPFVCCVVCGVGASTVCAGGGADVGGNWLSMAAGWGALLRQSWTSTM